jgi:hypothetical protein
MLAVSATLLLSLCTSASSSSAEASTSVDGKLLFPLGRVPPASTVNVALTLEGGRQLRAYPKADMSWQLSGVPAGAYLLEATALGYTMPSVRLDVGQDGAVDASYTEVPLQTLPLPIEIRAVPLDYFDKVVPFNVMAWLQSPMGMMAGFMVFAIVIMPYLKVDPEEYKQLMEESKREKRGQPPPERVAAAGAPQRALPPGTAQQRSRSRR